MTAEQTPTQAVFELINTGKLSLLTSTRVGYLDFLRVKKVLSDDMNSHYRTLRPDVYGDYRTSGCASVGRETVQSMISDLVTAELAGDEAGTRKMVEEEKVAIEAEDHEGMSLLSAAVYKGMEGLAQVGVPFISIFTILPLTL